MLSSLSSAVVLVGVHAKPLAAESMEMAVALGSGRTSWVLREEGRTSVCIYVLNVIVYLQPTAVVLISNGMHYRLKSCGNKFP